MLKGLRKNNKKGFTLVELIVVLVILAILAALLIPALTGYIDKAKEKQIVAETRQIVMAAQTLVDEKYGTLKLDEAVDIKFVQTLSSGASADPQDIAISEVENLSEITGLTVGTNVKITFDTTDKKKIKEVRYMENKVLCVYDAENSSYATKKNATGIDDNL